MKPLTILALICTMAFTSTSALSRTVSVGNTSTGGHIYIQNDPCPYPLNKGIALALVVMPDGRLFLGCWENYRIGMTIHFHDGGSMFVPHDYLHKITQ